ncbi:MAG: universal stress protein [Bacteroidota bacterium]
MNTIISAIDFSKSSLHALEYAINLANKVESDIIMTWVDTTSNVDSDISAMQREQRHEIKEQFDELIEIYQPKLLNGKLSYKLRKGKIFQEIANQAKYEDAGLVVAGSHGISGYEKYWIGSNAYRIVSYSPCPVITVRLNYNFKKEIKTIILPIDSTLETRQKVPQVANLARFYDSEIHILAVYTSSIKTIMSKVDQYAEQAAKFIHQSGVKFQVETLKVNNLTTEVIKYAEKVDADLISIMTEQETSASNILLGPYAQQMVNNSPIPVLTVQAEEIMKIHTGN